ncbi:MAG: zinc-binding dehydrogenase [Atopobiaceae bacterium]|nr:zinc-binding dehydrogenase [Atopobiaceae bacterium]
MNRMMNAVVVREPGGPEVLEYTQMPIPEVREDWSLVRVVGFGINHSEVFTRQGLSPSVRFPRILGIECVGEVAVTTNPERLPVGTRVASLMGEMGRAFDGGYAEYALLPNAQIYPIRTCLSWECMAAVPETYYTAYLSLRNLRIENRQRVLVRAATSGVGVAFAKLARAGFDDLTLVGSIRSASKAAQTLDAGFDECIIDNGGVLGDAGTFDRVLELVGPATMKDTCAHVREGGIVCSTGQLGGKWYLDGFDPIMDLPRNGYLTSAYSANVDGRVLQELFDFVEQYNVDVAPAAVFSLERVCDAHALIETHQSFGKLVVLT